MVRYLRLASVLFLFFTGGKSFAQILRDTTHAFELPDESQIANEIFLRTTEDIFAEQLQFIADDLERMSLPASHSRVLIRSRAVLDPDAEGEDLYQSGSYRGSPIKTVSRIIAKNDDVLFSLTQAKAAGEPLYFDHISGCFALRHSVAITEDAALTKGVLGDYSLSFGNGLLFSNGYNLFPSREVNLNVVPHSNGIRPYISSSSFRFFRGAAAELTSGIFSVSGFFSDRMIDATIDSNTITSLYNTGYHRTASELARKEKAQTKLTGGHISMSPVFDEGSLEIGATGYSLHYDKQVVKDSLSLGFSGKDHAMISAEIRTAFSFFSASGEYAGMISDAGNANAIAASLIAAPLDLWEMSLNFRVLPVNFISPFGGTFGINSQDAQNETGWYFGSKVTIIPQSLWLFGAMDIARSEDRGNSDLHYSDVRIGSKYILPSFPLQLILQFRSYGKGHLLTLSNDSLSKSSLRLDVSADLSRTIKVSLRGELQRTISQTDSVEKNGSIFAVKMRYAPLEELVISSGIAFFTTDSYAARFYSNEADLSGSAPFVALYGKGFRYYLQCSYDIANAITLSARVAQTKYAPSPGSPQLQKTSLGLQCDLTF